jgi:hypothetical protein
MRKIGFVSTVAIVILGAALSTASAQGTAARFLFFDVKPGAKAQFEQAIREQMEARRSKGESWRWLAWEYVTGGVPRYGLASFGHDWADFDQTCPSSHRVPSKYSVNPII